MVKRHDGSHVVEFRDAGEQWVAKLYYQESGIVHLGSRLPTRTEFCLETVREFCIHVSRHPGEDPVGEQKANFHIAPCWNGMKVENSGAK